MHVNKKRLHLYELPLQYHLQKRKESYELPAKSENQMQQEFLLPGSDDQGYSHALYKCPAISGVFHQKKGHPILPDFVLSMLGHLQAVLLNEELSEKISGVYCSPLLRAIETAGHMAPELPHIIVSDLSERNLGEWDGLSFDEIRQRWPDIYKAQRIL